MKWSIGSFLKIPAFLIYIFPRRLQMVMGDVLAYLAFDILRFRRKLALEHIRRAFPEWDDSKTVSVARASYKNLGRSLVEYANLPFINKNWINKNCVVHGLENYARASAQDKGVLLFTLHLGNGDLVMACLAQLGFPLYLISKHFKSEWLNQLWFGLREKMGMRFISEEKSSFQILRKLNSKGLIVFVLDQFMGPPAGVKTKFFGHDTGTASGLALFALRSGAPVIPAFTYRLPDGRFSIVFEPEVSTTGQSIESLTQKFTDHLEGIIRKHPDQWLWLHRRWKTFEVR